MTSTTPLRHAALDWVNRSRHLVLPPGADVSRRPWVRPQPVGIVLRGARPSDAAAVSAMHGRCSMDSVFRRYLCAVPAVSAALQQRLLTTTVALVAVDDGGVVRALGNVAELSAGEAELAIIVEDAYQGRGLGTTMARHLAAAARLAGYAALRMELLPSSAAAAHVAGGLGPAIVDARQGVITRTVRLRVETLAGLAAA